MAKRTVSKPDWTANPGERPQEKCGVFAVHNYTGPDNAAVVTYHGLLALQHRGQESAGMAFCDQKGMQVIKNMGLVDQVFSRRELDAIIAPSIIGHVRYSTTGSSILANAQPLIARSYNQGGIALAHNGNLTNTRRLYNKLLDEGQIFHTTSDTEIMLTYLFRYRRSGLAAAVNKTMRLIEGAYDLGALPLGKLMAYEQHIDILNGAHAVRPPLVFLFPVPLRPSGWMAAASPTGLSALTPSIGR